MRCLPTGNPLPRPRQNLAFLTSLGVPNLTPTGLDSNDQLRLQGPKVRSILPLFQIGHKSGHYPRRLHRFPLQQKMRPRYSNHRCLRLGAQNLSETRSIHQSILLGLDIENRQIGLSQLHTKVTRKKGAQTGRQNIWPHGRNRRTHSSHQRSRRIRSDEKQFANKIGKRETKCDWCQNRNNEPPPASHRGRSEPGAKDKPSQIQRLRRSIVNRKRSREGFSQQHKGRIGRYRSANQRREL